MKRLYAVLSLILVVVVFALPSIARADDGTQLSPAGWSWDESGASPSADGWSWDEA